MTCIDARPPSIEAMTTAEDSNAMLVYEDTVEQAAHRNNVVPPSAHVAGPPEQDSRGDIDHASGTRVSHTGAACP